MLGGEFVNDLIIIDQSWILGFTVCGRVLVDHDSHDHRST